MFRVAQFIFNPTKHGKRDIARKVAFLYQRTKWNRSLLRRTPYANRVRIDRPIFLLGVQGGGLTLLGRVLVREGSVCTASGNARHWAAPLDEIGLHASRMKRLPPSLWHAAHRDDLPQTEFGTNHGNVFAADALLPYYRETAADATPEEAAAFARLIREHILVYARSARHARFLDKTQTYTVKASFVNELLRPYSPHFILVPRDPYASAYLTASRVLGPERSFEERLRLAAQHWRNSMRCALEDASGIEHFKVLRFEDFIADPETRIRELCDFVELRFVPEMLGVPGEKVPRDASFDGKWYPLRTDHWRARVTAEGARIVDEECRAEAELLGYGLFEG